MTTTTINASADRTCGIEIQAMPWWSMILVRTARSFLQSYLGLFTASSIGVISIGQVKTMALVAACPAFVCFLQNSIEILSKLDTNDKYAAYRA